MALNDSNSQSQDEITNDYVIQKTKDKLEQCKFEAYTEINQSLDKMMSKILDDIVKKETYAGQIDHLFNYHDEIQDKVKTKEGYLPDKQFLSRNSLLTDLLEVKHIKSIYHIFLAALFGMFVNTVANDLLLKGELKLGLELMVKSFCHLPSLMTVWTCMFLTTVLIYVGLHVWASIRIQLSPKSIKLKILDGLGLGLIICYFPWFIFSYTTMVINYELTIAESIAALCELTRFLMKGYAFVRTVAPRVLSYKLHTENQLYYPEFTKYLYYLFVPTLIYQDSYPRTKHIRWGYVLKCFLEVFACVFYVSFILERFLVPNFADYGLKNYGWQNVVLMILSSGMVGALLKLTTFYCVLHAWMNGFAEMLRFGDRMFYKDWWTSTSYGRYYRTWNVVVHDWLYTYIYKDMYEIVTPKNKTAAKFMVFLISALFHEFILGFSFKFCYPVLFLQFFGIGMAVSSIQWENQTLANTGLWYGLGLGMGIFISTICMEFYARLNCPNQSQSIVDYFIPQSIFCNS